MIFLSGLLKGNPARYWRLQREGNAQEHMGAQARIQTLPRRGEDGRITFQVLRRYSLLPLKMHRWSKFVSYFGKHNLGKNTKLPVTSSAPPLEVKKKKTVCICFSHLRGDCGLLVSTSKQIYQQRMAGSETKLTWWVSLINILYFVLY